MHVLNSVRQLIQIQVEYADSTQKDFWSDLDLDQGSPCCEVTVLFTDSPYHSLKDPGYSFFLRKLLIQESNMCFRAKQYHGLVDVVGKTMYCMCHLSFSVTCQPVMLPRIQILPGG